MSDNYRLLESHEVDQIAAKYAGAWQDPTMPQRQYDTIVEKELARLRNGEDVLPYRVFLEAMAMLNVPSARLLDIGAASGYYSEVLRLGGYQLDYTGLDFSESFRAAAKSLFPGIKYDIGDARALPYADEEFDIVLHGAVLMHCYDYELAIREAVRVSSRVVIFHRTPIVVGKPAEFYEKDGYGVQMFECHFNEEELLNLFSESGLRLIGTVQLFFHTSSQSGMRTYVMEKR